MAISDWRPGGRRGWDTHNGPRGGSTPMMTRKPEFLTKLLGAEVERSPAVTDEC